MKEVEPASCHHERQHLLKVLILMGIRKLSSLVEIQPLLGVGLSIAIPTIPQTMMDMATKSQNKQNTTTTKTKEEVLVMTPPQQVWPWTTFI
jgi:uncharacterized membrane protein